MLSRQHIRPFRGSPAPATPPPGPCTPFSPQGASRLPTALRTPPCQASPTWPAPAVGLSPPLTCCFAPSSSHRDSPQGQPQLKGHQLSLPHSACYQLTLFISCILCPRWNSATGEQDGVRLPHTVGAPRRLAEGTKEAGGYLYHVTGAQTRLGGTKVSGLISVKVPSSTRKGDTTAQPLARSCSHGPRQGSVSCGSMRPGTVVQVVDPASGCHHPRLHITDGDRQVAICKGL